MSGGGPDGASDREPGAGGPPILPEDAAWAGASASEQARGASALRFSGRPGHVESWFLKANDPASPIALWLRFTVLAPTKDPDIAEVWAVVFDKRTGRHRAIKEGFPLREAQLSRERLQFRVGRNRLEADWTRGHLHAASGHVIRWDLRFDAGAPPLRLLGGPARYSGRFPRTKTITPNPSARFHGEVEVDDTRYAVEGWPGMLGHNWGREHAYSHAWVHANVFAGAPDTYFEAVSARVLFGPLPLPRLTVALLHHAGRDYDFRGVRHWWNRSVDVSLFRYRFIAADREVRLEGELSAEARDFVGLVYQDPSGRAAHCLNTKVARARLRLSDRATGRELADLVCDDKAALELLVRDPGHGVRMYL